MIRIGKKVREDMPDREMEMLAKNWVRLSSTSEKNKVFLDILFESGWSDVFTFECEDKEIAKQLSGLILEYAEEDIYLYLSEEWVYNEKKMNVLYKRLEAKSRPLEEKIGPIS